MNIRKVIQAAIVLSIFLSFSLFTATARAQKDKKVELTAAPQTRTLQRHENHRLSFGGSVTISGAPVGSVAIEGWDRREVDITADIEWQAGSAADLDKLALVNNFVVDVDTNHIRIITTGTHDKKFMKQAGKNFPKALLGMPWKINFKVMVPSMTDLEIDNGIGPVKLSGVEGAIRLNALQSDADLTITGGFFSAIIQRGAVNVRIPVRSWRGMGASLQLAGGTLGVSLMPGFSGDINANILRLGEITNTYQTLLPRENNSI
ncbi:MAG TPA: hypothetical protein VJT71_18045, partial [Pyrinomonadaceae bacterium]|nr:hypothetical protein [Pyrinomonadaceae bacterium]